MFEKLSRGTKKQSAIKDRPAQVSRLLAQKLTMSCWLCLEDGVELFRAFNFDLNRKPALKETFLIKDCFSSDPSWIFNLLSCC